jgi:hypothetical protein
LVWPVVEARRQAGQSKRQAASFQCENCNKISGSAGWKVIILNKTNGHTRFFSQKVIFHFM